MRNMIDGYPFVFVMNDKSNLSHPELEYTLQYRFKSEKSHHTYIVRVERYRNHFYCLKFFDKAMMHSNNKFSLRTHTFEPRTIFYTLYYIMLDVLKNDPLASFFFVGAEDERDEQGKSTRRFRVYRRFVLSTVTEEAFKHYRLSELSLYILANRNSHYANDESIQTLIQYVRIAFNPE